MIKLIETINWTDVIVAVLLFGGTIYGHWKTAQTQGSKTINALKGEINAVNNNLKDEIQCIRGELSNDRMASKASDEELHAELLLFKQESMAAFEKQSAASAAAADKALSVYTAKTDSKIEDLTREVREHNNFARRVPVIEQRLDNVERRLDKM